MNYLEAVTELLAHLRLKRYSPSTIDLYSDQLKRFGEWFTTQPIHDLRQLTKTHLLAYQAHVRKQPIKPETQAMRIRALKRLFGHLIESGKLVIDPTEGIQEISRRNRLPRPVLTPTEINRLLDTPNTSLRYGIRDRALIEVLYATGVRVGELEKMTVHHVDLDAQTLQVRHAKGGRPRVVPLGKNATKWLKEYLTQVRPRLSRRRPFERTLFIVRGGAPMVQTAIRELLRRYAQSAKIKKTVTPHILRHTCATHLLQRGADIRMIQQLLGHISLKSTTIYTRVLPLDVKATHTKTHPSERETEHADR